VGKRAGRFDAERTKSPRRSIVIGPAAISSCIPFVAVRFPGTESFVRARRLVSRSVIRLDAGGAVGSPLARRVCPPFSNPTVRSAALRRLPLGRSSLTCTSAVCTRRVRGGVGRVSGARRGSNKFGGRDHWPGGGSALFLRWRAEDGTYVGTTSSGGEYPGHPAPTPRRTFWRRSTHVLGIDPAATFPTTAAVRSTSWIIAIPSKS